MLGRMTRTALLALAALAPPLLASAQPSTAAPAPDASQHEGAPADLAPVLAEIDAAYEHRDDPAQLELQRSKLAEAEKLAPGNYDVLWRQARLNVWLADDPKAGGKEKERLGKIAWDYGDKATAANPGRVEGWYWGAAGMGLYGLGIGVITALKQGIEGKFKERLSTAEKIDPNYNHGGIQTAWGRLYYEALAQVRSTEVGGSAPDRPPEEPAERPRPRLPGGAPEEGGPRRGGAGAAPGGCHRCTRAVRCAGGATVAGSG